MEAITAAGTVPAAILVLVSFFSFLAGTAFRRWPDKVQAYVEDYDGFALFVTREAYRATITFCGWLLIVLSLIALIAAGMVA